MDSSDRDKEFLERLKTTFKIEAIEILRVVSTGLLELEKSPSPQQQSQILDNIFRQIHSLKGSSRAVDLTSIEIICQHLETIIKEFKSQDIPSSPKIYDILQHTIDTMDEIILKEKQEKDMDISLILQQLEEIETGKIEQSPSIPIDSPLPKEANFSESPRKRFTRSGFIGKPNQTVQSPPSEDWGSAHKATMNHTTLNTLRVSSSQLDNLLRQAEEMIQMKLSLNRHLTNLKALASPIEEMKKRQTTTVPLVNTIKKKIAFQGIYWEPILDFFNDSMSIFKDLDVLIRNIYSTMKRDQHQFSNMLNTHLEDIRKTLMLPFSTITESFPRMVRDLARQQGKQIDFQIQGQETHVDKRILEEIKHPLFHLLRNAIDHGIEKPIERKNKKKSSEATLNILIHQPESKKIEIQVSDDGRGIDIEKIKKTAINSGIYTQKELKKLTHHELLSLVFNSEFSTSPKITSLSGRGLGLAIVREKVNHLGGRINIESSPNKGTCIKILLQTTLATFRGTLIECAQQKFIIPTLNVQQVLEIKPEAIKTIKNHKTIEVDREILAILNLTKTLQLSKQPTENQSSKNQRVVVLSVGSKKIAFRVDDILNEEEVLVKDMGQQLVKIKNISGVTILGSGEIVPIIHVQDLIETAIRISSQLSKDTSKKISSSPPSSITKKSILVVEDSITSRMLLKNILESAGYIVEVSVNGIDGWMALNDKYFDLTVLDVEMPGLNGFELTEKIRQNPKLEDLPVILVTGLESREDKERGIDVGADAYIVKSSFDQSNLLDVVKKLI